MINKYLLQLFFLCFSFHFFGITQNAVFLKSGRIFYERKINEFALWNELSQSNRDGQNPWIDQLADRYKKNNSQFDTATFILDFDSSRSIFRKISVRSTKNNDFFDFSQVYSHDIVYNNFFAQESVSKRIIGGNEFWLKDSALKIKWKITDEYKDIAGLRCRRANGLLFDSIYIVAFYSNQILSLSGPEFFSGLPGMILGLALPHEHVTWFATKIFAESKKDEEFKIPSKKIFYTNKELLYKLHSSLNDNDIFGKFILKHFVP